ncbi:MAG: phage portal protein [Rickettsiales bacterium]|nr:MAG: phage portal protein [Rickettsiales bacterium]
MKLFNFFRKSSKAQTRNMSQRKYAAASINRLNADWVTSVLSADSELYNDLRTLRSRSRELCMNNDYARRFLKRTGVNVIGATGIRLQVKAKDNSGKLLREINSHIEEQFHLWAKKGNCSVCGKLSWVDSQKLFLESVARDGEVIVRLVKGFDNDFGFALQFLEADHLDEDLNMPLDNGGYIRMGIEFNKWNRPVAYHLLSHHPSEVFHDKTSYEKKYQRIPASEIIHGFLIDRPSQSRGVPWMHTAMPRLRMLAGYEEAELVAARVGASKMGFFVSPDGTGYAGSEHENDSPIMEADPGTFEQLPSGMDVRMFDPNHPAGNFASFEKAILRGVASGLDISYNTLANDLEDVNFSSIRHGSLEDRDSWKVLQNWVIEHFCRPVFEAWLLMSITSGKIEISATDFDKFNKPVWRARGWAWVDPLKENHANQIAINQKTKTRAQVAADQGMDVEELFQQLAFEDELAKEYGLDLNTARYREDRDRDKQLDRSSLDGDSKLDNNSENDNIYEYKYKHRSREKDHDTDDE